MNAIYTIGSYLTPILYTIATSLCIQGVLGLAQYCLRSRPSNQQASLNGKNIQKIESEDLSEKEIALIQKAVSEIDQTFYCLDTNGRPIQVLIDPKWKNLQIRAQKIGELVQKYPEKCHPYIFSSLQSAKPLLASLVDRSR